MALKRVCLMNRFYVSSLLVFLLTLIVLPGDSRGQDRFQPLRDRLVQQRIAAAGVKDPRVLKSIRETPRHEFVPPSQREKAYLDMALPIGHSQTISSPFIVALMTEALEPKPTDKVLEIGTGSGYQAAVLSPLVDQVYTIEIVKPLGEAAKEVLERLHYDNVHTRVGDGFLGWPEAAPFDKIIVTCSPESVPTPLVEQLREGGQMIIPVGERYQQTLYRMVKKDGKLQREALRPTLFVPMTGEAEESRQELPDAANPKVVNGDFQQLPEKKNIAIEDYVPGWYYGRQLKHVTAGAGKASSGSGNDAFVRFHNETPGLSSHLLQGIPMDGRKVSTIRLGGKVRTGDVRTGPDALSRPMIALSLYDEQRRELDAFVLGPFRSSRPWRSSSRLIRIPPNTREAILRIGLFGATGTADFDDLSIEKID